MRNLNARIERTGAATGRGLIRAGMLIKREAQKLCPVDTGNMRSSAFIAWTGGVDVGGEGQAQGGGRFRGERAEQTAMEFLQTAERARSTLSQNPQQPEVAVGFGASYALFVHERPANHAVGTDKFLEKAVAQNMDALVATVADEARRGR